ncbi:MAG: ribonuclease Y [Actinomycetes bacterium]
MPQQFVFWVTALGVVLTSLILAVLILLLRDRAALRHAALTAPVARPRPALTRGGEDEDPHDDVHDDALRAGGELDRREQRLAGRERRLRELEVALESREVAVTAAESAISARLADAARLERERQRQLEEVAGLTRAQARAQVVLAIESQAKREAALLARRIESEAKEQAEARARHLVAQTLPRVAASQTSETAVTVVPLPSEDLKGRIIGREGRNIRTFEQITGVNVLVDDTPGAVVLSCFDPYRREVARLTLEALVADGRIHPHRIEEMHELSERQVEQASREAAESALLDAGLDHLHPELMAILGRLRYRTSYGQNVLAHCVETAQIAGVMAAELGVDPRLVRRAAFLHDIGKALTHEVEGSHAMVGADLARRYGEPEEVVHAIEAHHDEVPPETVEALLTQAADACSGGRPGARRESIESYVNRLHRLEEIALGHEGVDKVFAMQAGHEVRVMVLPDVVDDIAAQVLARDIAKQVEEELTYPGQIRVTVIRESRATEVAR